MAKKRSSGLINRMGTYSTTPKSKFISTLDEKKGEGHYKYIPKTKENMEALVKLKGKPEVFDDKRGGKRLIWW